MAFILAIKTTNRELLRLSAVLDKYGHIQDGRLAFALARNRVSLKSFTDSLEEVRKIDPELQKAVREYEVKRLNLNKKHAVKDENGVPREQRGGYVISDQDRFDADMNVLNVKNASAVTEKDRIAKAWDDALDLDVDFQPYAIPYRKIPVDSIQAQDLAIFLEFEIISGEPDWGDDEVVDSAPPTPIAKNSKSRKKKR